MEGKVREWERWPDLKTITTSGMWLVKNMMKLRFIRVDFHLQVACSNQTVVLQRSSKFQQRSCSPWYVMRVFIYSLSFFVCFFLFPCQVDLCSNTFCKKSILRSWKYVILGSYLSTLCQFVLLSCTATLYWFIFNLTYLSRIINFTSCKG